MRKEWDHRLCLKKGDRSDLNIYCGVYFPYMCSHVLAKVISKRLSILSERLDLLDDNPTNHRYMSPVHRVGKNPGFL